MQLFHSPASPFVRKVRVLAIEAGLADRIELLAVQTTALDTDAGLARANPVGKIPTLLREDGPALHDSRVICRYLDAQAGAGFYPESRLWEVLTLESMADGVLEAAVLVVYERRFREEAQHHEGWLAGQADRIVRSLDAIEAGWISHLAGPVNAAQIGVACALGYLDFRLPEIAWREDRPALSAWYKRFAARPSMEQTAPSAAA